MSLRTAGKPLGVGFVCLAIALSTPVTASGDPGHDRKDANPAPIHRTGKPSEIAGQYIVVMDRRTSRDDRAATQRQAVSHGGRVSVEYGAALTGFAAALPDAAVEALRHNPHVAYLEADAEVQASDTQSGASWGLDRIDQRFLPLNGIYRYDETGAGVTAYIIDTGIRRSHTQFGGRVAGGFTAIRDGRGTGDCNGHGTHVAGTVGSKRYGVAKAVALRPVRVLNCRGNGTLAGIVAGIDWVTSHHTSGVPAVANMSLDGDASEALDTAVRNSILDGITYAVAAGNDNSDACDYSPARVGPALTVGASTKSDARASYSNSGSCLDLFAPGSGVTSTWNTSNTATKTLSGTSMAAPHVAGAAALILQQQPSATPGAVAQALVQSVTTGVVSNKGYGSPNRLLYALGSIEPPPPAADNLVRNGGFEEGSTGWTATEGVITQDPSMPAHQGSWKAWLGGYGEAHTDTVAQPVTIPSAATASLSFFLLISSDEDPSTVYDRLEVQVQSDSGTSTLATYSNVEAGTTYVKRSIDLSAFAGRTVTLRFIATEDESVLTGFVTDDVVLTAR
jgi:hypothetical protein